MSDKHPDNKPDEQFWEFADSFIGLANEHCDQAHRSRVSATFLYAVARFNAFVVAASTRSKDQLIAEKEQAVRYFLGQYEKMLRENLADYENHYEKYIATSPRVT
jgi:hypothetical protein